MSRDQFDPKSPNYPLYQMQLFSIKRSYPGGNFEENQQLNDSMSISPLYTTVSIDLHVRTPVGPPPVFQQASPSSCKDHHLSGCIRINFAQILQKNSDRQNVPGPFLIDPFHPIHFHYAFFGFLTTILSTLMHSLIRVPRRDIWRVSKIPPERETLITRAKNPW